MLRTVLLSLLAAAYLILVALWPPALAPISLVLAGLAAAIGAIPGPVLLLAGVIAWLKKKPARPTAA